MRKAWDLAIDKVRVERVTPRDGDGYRKPAYVADTRYAFIGTRWMVLRMEKQRDGELRKRNREAKLVIRLLFFHSRRKPKKDIYQSQDDDAKAERVSQPTHSVMLSPSPRLP